MFDDLKTKTTLVTGAFGGLGRHFALTLARAGCRVALAGRRTGEGEKVLAEIRSGGGDGCVVRLDVREPESVQRALDDAAARLGPIAVLVNSAGVAVTRPALDQTEEDWTGVIDVNLNGAWRVAQAAARQMCDRGKGGSIINIASILGLRVAQQVPAYAAAKAGLIQLTRALALELARFNIRVNALAPATSRPTSTATSSRARRARRCSSGCRSGASVSRGISTPRCCCSPPTPPSS